MNERVLAFCREPDLTARLHATLGDRLELASFETVETLKQREDWKSIAAVLVHFSERSWSGRSAGRFVAELTEAVQRVPIYALLDADCSTRLRQLARQSSDDRLYVPQELERLPSLLSEKTDLETQLARFCVDRPHKQLHAETRSLVTFTPEMFDMLDQLKVAAAHDVTVLLIGETGSGKTYLARLIYELSDRRKQRFCTVACGALPPDLIESELFGYVKGAFTGADRDKQGKFAATGRGTLLLDEIDVLSPKQQTKLLRVIETGEYEPLGSNEPQRSEARLVVASNCDLERLVEAGLFRSDLYYRLNVLNLRLLPLRERPWDIEYLARQFVLDHSRTHDVELRRVEPTFFDALRRYRWPGNIREMENVIRRAVLYCRRGTLTPRDLPSAIRSAAVGLVPAGTYPQPRHHRELAADHLAEAHRDGGPRAGLMGMTGTNAGHLADTAASGGVRSAVLDMPIDRSRPPTLVAHLDMVEQRIIEDSLDRNHHRRKDTAAELGISRVTLYNKMRKFGMMS